MILYYILFFLVCCAALYFAGGWVVSGLARIAKFLGMKEFAVAFFIMAAAGTLPNLILMAVSIINGVPELSLGDVVGGNVVDMTFTIALAAFLSRRGIDARNRTVQASAVFTFFAAILPLALFLDGRLSRADGLILLSFFAAYVYWLLSKKERFSKVYNNYKVPLGKQFSFFIKDIAKVVTGTAILMAVAQGIVVSANAFSADFNVALPLVGILVVGLGNCFPEIYFCAVSARASQTKMMLGDVMGAIIMPGTMVLGILALVSPMDIPNIAMFGAARYFLMAAAVFFLISVRTGQKVTKKEGALLLFIYIAFLITEIFVK